MPVGDTTLDAVPTLEQRIVELECRLAHQECAVEDLSSMVVTQGHMIDALTLQVHRLIDRLKDQDASWGASPQDSKPPPHY